MQFPPLKDLSLYLMALLYIAAGVNHFINPKAYLRIMPSYLPFPEQLVFWSGVCEIVLGVLLIPVTIRPVAAWLVIALLIAVFPANIQMAVNYYNRHNPYLWIALVRLPLQAVLIWWAWLFTK
jgi:uncharacterized membrane protein